MLRRFLLLALLGACIVVNSGCATSRFYHLPTLEFEELDYYGKEVKTAKVRNLEVAYLEWGQGEEVLLLIHGLGSNAKAWLRNAEAWSQGRRVIAVDLPGYGKSTKGELPYSLSFYVQVLVEMLDGLGIERASWAGHSMGGQIAILAALDQPQRVDKLVLFAPAGFERFLEGEGQWLREAVTAEFVQDTPVRNIAVNLKANFHRYPPEAEFMITDRIQVRGASGFPDYCYAVSKNVGAMLDEPVADRLSDLTVPTLILFGENDGLIPNPYLHGGHTRDVAAIGAREIVDNELLVISECGHFVQFERFDVVNPAVEAFLGR